MEQTQKILYTQRVELVESYGERRDCADRRIPAFLRACGYLPIPLPNIPGTAQEMIHCLRPAGILLTGGNSLVTYGGNAPERDALEKELLELALQKDIPLYGFCRGMQVIEDYFGAVLQDIPGHVAVRHKLQGPFCDPMAACACGPEGAEDSFIVNSYHNQGCYRVPDSLEILAACEDGVIEAVRVRGRRVLGTMWHPEREDPFRREDIDRVRRIFGKEGWTG